MLQTEKSQIELRFLQIEQHIGQIDSHEEKLRRVFDSLSDLLDADGTHQTEILGAPVTQVEDSEDEVKDASHFLRPVEIESTPVVAPPKIADQATSISVEAETPESASTDTAILLDQLRAIGENNVDSTTLPVNNAASVVTANQSLEEKVSTFNPTDFFTRFPHIQRTHPIHVLARKLLEYFDAGLKLGEITRLIERLGYQHSSRNFVDSVHSALKNKRKTTGEFRFNTKKGIWELEHRETAADDEQADELGAKQLILTSSMHSESKTSNNQQKIEMNPTSKGGKSSQSSGAGNLTNKRVTENGISVYKREL